MLSVLTCVYVGTSSVYHGDGGGGGGGDTRGKALGLMRAP